MDVEPATTILDIKAVVPKREIMGPFRGSCKCVVKDAAKGPQQISS